MTTRRWQFWIDRGGTFTDIVGARARRHAGTRSSCCRRTPSSTATRRSRASATCWACSAGEPITPRAGRGVKMGTTVATNALLERKGERTAAGHHARLSRRAAHRLPEPAAPVRPPHRAARAALRARDRGRRARRRARRGGAAARRGRAARATLQAAFDARHPRAAPSSSCTATATPRTSRRPRGIAREVGFTQVSRLARGQPADEAGRRAATPRWSTPTCRRSCAATSTRSPREMPGVRAVLHAVERRPDRRARASRARTRSCPARPAASSAWCAPRVAAGHRQGHRLRHGRHLDRRVALRRRVRARVRDRRWPACACARR